MHQAHEGANPLNALNLALRELSRHVSPSVVEVQVNGYRPVDEIDRGQAGLVLGSQETIGSGTIVDSEGYILVNAHLVAGAQSIQVLLHLPAETPHAAVSPPKALKEQSFVARVVGLAADVDLALLKIEATGLVALKMTDSALVRQGDVVFAFGNPAGLPNSMSMGIVSAVARLLDDDSPNVYIQTDATINPGNSGGPLVNADGELIGINTLMVSDSGGSQGLGFAIPSAVVAVVYPQLREFGKVQRGTVGIQVQAITGALAAGLGLSRTSGVIISDVLPDGPADRADVRVQDIVLAMDGHPIPNVPAFVLQSYVKSPGDLLTLALLRGSTRLTVSMQVTLRSDDAPSDKLATQELDVLPKLGILAANIGSKTAPATSKLRIQSGVLVVARDRRSLASEVLLVAGDVIHAVGGITVRSVDTLQVLVDSFKRNAQIVLQVERDGRLRYITQKVF